MTGQVAATASRSRRNLRQRGELIGDFDILLLSNFVCQVVMHTYGAYMRTTLLIADELYADVKRLAAGRRTSVSRVVSDALRRELSGSAAAERPARVCIPVFGDPGQGTVDTKPLELDALLHDEL